jgi:hypothetical protein
MDATDADDGNTDNAPACAATSCRAAYCDGYRDGYAAAERLHCRPRAQLLRQRQHHRQPPTTPGPIAANCTRNGPAGGLAGGSDGGETG